MNPTQLEMELGCLGCFRRAKYGVSGGINTRFGNVGASVEFNESNPIAEKLDRLVDVLEQQRHPKKQKFSINPPRKVRQADRLMQQSVVSQKHQQEKQIQGEEQVDNGLPKAECNKIINEMQHVRKELVRLHNHHIDAKLKKIQIPQGHVSNCNPSRQASLIQRYNELLGLLSKYAPNKLQKEEQHFNSLISYHDRLRKEIEEEKQNDSFWNQLKRSAKMFFNGLSENPSTSSYDYGKRKVKKPEKKPEKKPVKLTKSQLRNVRAKNAAKARAAKAAKMLQ